MTVLITYFTIMLMDLVPHRLDRTLDKSLLRGDTPHLTSRFFKDELGSQISTCYPYIMISHNTEKN